MRTTIIGIVALGFATACAGRAQGWAHAGRYGTASGGGGSWQAHGYAGGSASGGGGSWSGHSAYGGSASGGDGSWHGTGAQGGTASGGGGSWQAHDDGTTVYGGVDDHNYYGGTYSTYHPPTVVNEYGGGCYDCGGWDTAGAAAVGVAAGVAVGAAVGSAETTNAYNAGVAAGSAYAMNSIYPKLPAAGCTYTPVAGATYYLCNGIWFSPSYGANGVYYRVVPAP